MLPQGGGGLGVGVEPAEFGGDRVRIGPQWI